MSATCENRYTSAPGIIRRMMSDSPMQASVLGDMMAIEGRIIFADREGVEWGGLVYNQFVVKVVSQNFLCMLLLFGRVDRHVL